MATLLERFGAHVARARLFPRPGPALVAVSGGPDSVALLDLLHASAPAHGLSLIVAHADHGIQADSRSVGQAVRELAARYRLPFELGPLRLARAGAARPWRPLSRDGAPSGRPGRDDPATGAQGQRAGRARRHAGPGAGR